MAGILDYSTTPSSNTKINGIGIAGSDSIKNGDDAMRQMMADTRAAVTKASDKAAGSYTAAKSDHNQLWRATGAATVNLTAAATLTAGWCLWVQANGGNVTLDPAGSELINGGASFVVPDNHAALVLCTGTAFRAILFGDVSSTELGNAAARDVGTTAGTVAAGDDSRIVGALPKSGGTMTGPIVLAADPAAAMQPATKQYVDAQSVNPNGVATGWVNFNGTGTVAIRDSYNVSSITDNGTGDYTVNFASAYANTNYAVVCGAEAEQSWPSEGRYARVRYGGRATGSVRVTTGKDAAQAADLPGVFIAIFGGH